MKDKNIRKLGKDKWLVDLTCNKVRTRKIICGPKARAKQFLTLKRGEQFRRECGIPGKKKRIRFKDYVEIYKERHSKEKRSYKEELYRIGRMNSFFGEKFLDEITPGFIDNYVLKRKKEKKENSTINLELSFLKNILNRALESEEYSLERNPVNKVKFLEVKSVKERILTADEMKRLLEAAPTSWGGCLPLFLAIALNTGMRKKEILTLEWKHVNFKDRYLEVTEERSKSGKPRSIPMNDVIYEELMRIPRISRYVFYNPNTGKHIKNIKCTFSRACKAAEIKNLRIHDLRHTAASFLVNECGIDIVTASKILGHSKIDMTMKYIHPTEEKKREGVEALGEIFKRTRHNLASRPKPVRIEQPVSHLFCYN